MRMPWSIAKMFFRKKEKHMDAQPITPAERAELRIYEEAIRKKDVISSYRTMIGRL